MKAREFIFWLRGYFELSGSNTLTLKQIVVVYRHLQLVMEYDTAKSNEKDFCNWLLGCYDSSELPIPVMKSRLRGIFEQEQNVNTNNGLHDNEPRARC